MSNNHVKALTVEVDAASFDSEVLQSKKPVIVTFWAPWSRPCHVLDSALNEVATACAGAIKIAKVNADDNPDLSMWYEIQSVPTLLLFVKGTLRARIIGTASKEAILDKMQLAMQDNGSGSSNPEPNAHQ
jgi:thioredoxin 1